MINNFITFDDFISKVSSDFNTNSDKVKIKIICNGEYTEMDLLQSILMYEIFLKQNLVRGFLFGAMYPKIMEKT